MHREHAARDGCLLFLASKINDRGAVAFKDKEALLFKIKLLVNRRACFFHSAKMNLISSVLLLVDDRKEFHCFINWEPKIFLNSIFPLFRWACSAFLIEILRYTSKTASTLVEEQPLDITALSNFTENCS